MRRSLPLIPFLLLAAPLSAAILQQQKSDIDRVYEQVKDYSQALQDVEDGKSADIAAAYRTGKSALDAWLTVTNGIYPKQMNSPWGIQYMEAKKMLRGFMFSSGYDTDSPDFGFLARLAKDHGLANDEKVFQFLGKGWPVSVGDDQWFLWRRKNFGKACNGMSDSDTLTDLYAEGMDANKATSGAYQEDIQKALDEIGKILASPNIQTCSGVEGAASEFQRFIQLFPGERFTPMLRAHLAQITDGKIVTITATADVPAGSVDFSQEGKVIVSVAADCAQQALSTGSQVRMRADPGLSGKVLGLLAKGEPVTVVDRAPAPQTIDGVEARWYRVINSSGTAGWVFGKYLNLERPAVFQDLKGYSRELARFREKKGKASGGELEALFKKASAAAALYEKELASHPAVDADAGQQSEPSLCKDGTEEAQVLLDGFDVRPGFLVGGGGATASVYPRYDFWQGLAQEKGSAADVAFFGFAGQMPRPGLGGESFYEARTDLGGCYQYGTGMISSLYGQVLEFRAKFGQAYSDELKAPAETLESALTKGLGCICGGPESVEAELEGFLKDHPDAAIAPAVKEFLSSVKEGGAQQHYHCVPG